MADLGALVTIADKVFQLLQSPVLKELRGWKSEFKNMNQTISFIKNMLLDVDKKPELTHGEQGWVDELKEVLYDADDLFDEVITLAKQKELNGGTDLSKKLFDKVSRFFSSRNQFLASYRTSQEVKNIQTKLADIARDHGRYDFRVDSQATRERRAETCSFLDETHENIVGKEDDVKAIVDMLLVFNVERPVGVVAIVGVGGLGKTALAQLVFNHDSVKSRFDKMLWPCVSDQDGRKLDVQAIIRKIVESSTGKEPNDVSTLESLQRKLQEELKNKTYLLVLDDVWTEDPNEWGNLSKFLTIGARGSTIVVTTRSESTAEAVLGNSTCSNKFKYMLKALSDDASWLLFKLTAFGSQSKQANELELVNIGKKIVRKCSNVPLAIKVVGTLLYGQTHRWESFERSRLPEIENTKNPIMSVLKLSYINLEPSLKNCFRYCAFFPKDFEMEKEKLISLWMAQGYIVPSNESQSIEDAGEQYFFILLKRCFFQDVKKDCCDEIVSFKMHDLMHDLAQEVAGDEIHVEDCMTQKNIRHLFVVGEEFTKASFSKSHTRSCYINIPIDSGLVKTLAANWSCLRALRLRCFESLPESIGKLLHLRYLDLSENGLLKTLPNSITKLYNLHTLILSKCYGLEEWPAEFSRLINLQHLDITDCVKLTVMPWGIDKLTSLRVLTNFKVGAETVSGSQSVGRLKDLKALGKLRGYIYIWIGENFESKKENVGKGSFLEHGKNLKAMRISAFNSAHVAQLQPHRNVQQLHLSLRSGAKIPRWGRRQDGWEAILPNLVRIELSSCVRLQHLPVLSKLKQLKSLYLSNMLDLQYMENSGSNSSASSSSSQSNEFFPSLEFLSFCRMDKLKGWWSTVGEGGSSCLNQQPPLPRLSFFTMNKLKGWWRSQLQQPFPRLSTLEINFCPELMTFPPCPNLQSLEVQQSNKSLQITTGDEDLGNPDLKLRVQRADSMEYLTTLPAARLTSIEISSDWKVKSLAEKEEVFRGCSSSLRALSISSCLQLSSVSRGLEYLTALESLELCDLRIFRKEDDNSMPWRSLCHNLCSLKLKGLHSMKNLPRGMRHLTTLQHLSIEWCDLLEGLPEWISCLSSLQSLRISSCNAIRSLPAAVQDISSLQSLQIIGCPDLFDACQESNGVDWPKIRHIPRLHLSRYSVGSSPVTFPFIGNAFPRWYHSQTIV